MDLCRHLKDSDLKSFNFHDFLEFDLVLYFSYAVKGGRKFLLGEKDEDIPKHKRKYFRMRMLDKTVKFILYFTLFWFTFVKFDLFGVSGVFCKLVGYYQGNKIC